ncbi:hypothetical protein BDY21DRAFT_58544 [Lineolata rhizophorae]|uniref:Uncharacterized protein n=1 Tax=Lineolata rhizophorae TaxID=578093 RepID=A0A6A6NXF0_9PEZI|nr:hypothetical protein BDY21DRAFT_58544 [Lineolata rhizophorae]
MDSNATSTRISTHHNLIQLIQQPADPRRRKKKKERETKIKARTFSASATHPPSAFPFSNPTPSNPKLPPMPVPLLLLPLPPPPLPSLLLPPRFLLSACSLLPSTLPSARTRTRPVQTPQRRRHAAPYQGGAAGGVGDIRRGGGRGGGEGGSGCGAGGGAGSGGGGGGG